MFARAYAIKSLPQGHLAATLIPQRIDKARRPRTQPRQEVPTCPAKTLHVKVN